MKTCVSESQWNIGDPVDLAVKADWLEDQGLEILATTHRQLAQCLSETPLLQEHIGRIPSLTWVFDHSLAGTLKGCKTDEQRRRKLWMWHRTLLTCQQDLKDRFANPHLFLPMSKREKSWFKRRKSPEGFAFNIDSLPVKVGAEIVLKGITRQNQTWTANFTPTNNPHEDYSIQTCYLSLFLARHPQATWHIGGNNLIAVAENNQLIGVVVRYSHH